MALQSTPLCNYGEKIPNFKLKNVDESFVNQDMVKGENGTLVFFICNHCPYVKAITKKLIYTVSEITKYGIKSVGIMPNDIIKYPEDNFENMQKFFNKNKLNFPYLIDQDQSVTKKFDAVCTPDFFGYNSKNELQYRGRIAEMSNLEFVNDKNDLLEAMIEISKTQNGPKNQFASAGCSIKWK
jgi:peroxiredoxin